MQKLQDSVFSIVKTTNLSPAVFSYLQPSEDFPDKTPLGGILSDTKHGWLALGPKFCVVDLRTGLKVAQRTFGASLSNFRTTVTSVVELPTPLTENSQQLLISLECEDIAGMICVFHINGSQILRCIRTEVVVTELAVCDGLTDGPFTCFDGAIMAGTKTGEIFVFDLNRSSLIQALKDISQGYEHMIRGEENLSNISFLPLNAVDQIEVQRDLALENDDHIAVLLNENSLVDGQYIFRNPDGTVRMKAKRDHIRVTVIQYIPQLGSLVVGFNFGAFQIWNLLNLDLEFTSQVNVECLPVTHFGFQEPCDDPRAFCYLWVVFSVIDRFDEEEFPLAVMYSLTYQGKRMLSDTKCLYQEFLTATVRFQVELSTTEEDSQLIGGRCVSCHTYSVNSMLGGEGEDSMLNICQLVWECWGENANSSAQYGMLLFDLDQWYKDQMPATYQLQSNAFMSATRCTELARGATATLDVRLIPSSVSVYCAATRLEEHFYPNCLRYDCICLNTSESCVLSTTGIQRQIINSLDEVGPTALLNPTRLYHACVQTGLVPLYMDAMGNIDQEDQRRYLLSVALEARLSRFLKRCAHDWATGSHVGAGCTLTFLVDWCWKRAVDLKENARELTAPLFTSSALPDRNVVRCLDHCVQQLTQLTGLLDAVLTKCCNLVVPDALSEMEEKYKGIGCVSLYFQVVQWFLRVGLLPERLEACDALPYPGGNLADTYTKRRLKLHRLQDHNLGDESAAKTSCPLLYIDQLIENEFGGERINQMWMRGGSESGLYPPPSLYSLLRLYLLPDIAEEHKHSLVLYLLVDYSMVYDEVRYEAVIRRLMQFPTMFGLSNTAIKATQAFWHLDHRDFDFALDQLQCLTGNTLSEWQHNVVLSSLLAQKKTQAALQYLHVRKPAPIQNASSDMNSSRINDHDKLEDWQSCCNLYLARGLVFEALDVVRMCVQNAGSLEDKVQVMNFFYKGCRNSGQLSKLLQVTLLPFEEEIFIRYLENCNESQTSDILIMYYLQQARYLEAEQYNKKIKHTKPRKETAGSLESIADVIDREGARDILVEVLCSTLPSITSTVAHSALDRDFDSHIVAPKPMSVFIQAKSPKNKFTYKSTFIQDTIDNASEIWINKPKARKGLKRALNIEETPFICTPKLGRTKNIFNLDESSESTPPKRARLDLSGTPKTPRGNALRVSANISRQMAELLDMPEVQSPDMKLYERRGAETPHSILKIRADGLRDAASPVDSRYLGDSDDELLETASNHTHYSDSTNKHLRFTIPSETGSTPSPPLAVPVRATEKDRSISMMRDKDVDMSVDSFVTTQSHTISEPHPLESPPKKMAVEDKLLRRKSYKDSVRARRSLSISANSSLSDDPNTSIESIADIPVTLINPRYSGEKRRSFAKEPESTESATEDKPMDVEKEFLKVEAPKTPKGRRGIRAASAESTPLINRSRSGTPERLDSPVATTPLRSVRNTRSRSRTPEISPRSSPLDTIPEQPRQEVESEPHPTKTTLSVPRQLRSRSRTPERIEKLVESPRLEAIKESPTKSSDSPTSSPTRRNLRSRSRTPEVEIPVKVNEGNLSPRTLRSRAKTPEKLMSPKKDVAKSAKKPLARLVLEANAIAASKQSLKESNVDEKPETVIECTPMKAVKPVDSLMDVTLSPIGSKSILHSSNDSVLSETVIKETKSTDDSVTEIKSLPAFTMNETKFGKSVLHSYESSVAEITHEETSTKIDVSVSKADLKSLPAFTLSESYFEKSVLHSYQSSVADESSIREEKIETTHKTIALKASPGSTSFNITDLNKSVLGSQDNSLADIQDKTKDATSNSKTNVSSLMTSDSEIEDWKAEKIQCQDVIQKEKEKIVEIEREINDIEKEMSEDEESGESDGMVVDTDESESEDGEEEESEDSSEADEAASDDDVISIADTDSDESSSSSNVAKADKPTHETEEKIAEVNIEEANTNEGIKDKTMDKVQDSIEASIDPLNQGQISLLTDDNSMHSNNSVDLNYSDEEKDVEGNVVEKVEEQNVEIIEHQKAEEVKEHKVEKIDDTKVDKVENKVEKMETETTEIPIQTPVEAPATKEIETASKSPKHIPEPEKPKEKTPDLVDVVDTAVSTEKVISENKGADSKKSDKKEDVLPEAKELESETLEIDVRTKTPEKETKEQTSEKAVKPASRTKRTRSTASNKSTKEFEEEKPESKTPMTRKRSQSISNKSITDEQKTPEDSKKTPTRRAKTPTSTEVRKILTRRASKELSEKMDESQTSILDESLTPKRRSTRTRSKNIDDNASIASGSSVRSTRSKASEDAGDGNVKPGSTTRKGRKTVLPVKPDLSVIPESTVEEGNLKANLKEDVIAEYSSSRRLTRHQKSVLESWLEPKSSPSSRRRASTASRASAMSEASHEDDDASSTHSGAFDVQPIDRISLLNKGDFEARTSRAASEAKATPKAAKITRRVSVDIAGTPEVGSPVPGSPARGRRASFNRACEALHTPKGRRTSTDVKAEPDSQQGAAPAAEDAPATPTRRPRRTSTHSNSSQKADTSKRTRKLSAVEETKDTK
ncbi:protein ELYS isoform X3 [Pectinophora gossypiella]|uniref:protein ELYS isoform X3 n=1 Tax=Pectinophora gossypiella TaxID=13191 RepID=UPI00214EC521|nr:protein ELYS isoform X3 [Pectinophora gossypiella]